MTAQNYLNAKIEVLQVYNSEIVEPLKQLEKIVEKLGMNTEEAMLDAINNNELSDEDLEVYFRVSMMNSDVRALYTEIANIINFAQNTELELDYSEALKIDGLENIINNLGGSMNPGLYLSVKDGKLVINDQELYDKTKANFIEHLKRR